MLLAASLSDKYLQPSQDDQVVTMRTQQYRYDNRREHLTTKTGENSRILWTKVDHVEHEASTKLVLQWSKSTREQWCRSTSSVDGFRCEGLCARDEICDRLILVPSDIPPVENQQYNDKRTRRQGSDGWEITRSCLLRRTTS